MANFLSRLFGARSPQPEVTKDSAVGSFASPSPGLFYSLGGYVSNTGVPVSYITSLQISAVLACVQAKAQDIAKLPIYMDRGNPVDGYERILKHPILKVLHAPNQWHTPFTFWHTVVTSLELRGNAYIYVVRDKGGRPSQLIPIVPDRAAVMTTEQGEVYYQVSHPLFGNQAIKTTSENVIHIKNFSLDGGLMGSAPTQLSQDVFGVALAAQKHSARMFYQGTSLSGALEVPGKLTADAARNISESWQRTYAGSDNAHRVAFLEGGMKFQSIGQTAQESQLLEARRFGLEEIARIYRVPLHKIGILDHATFSNIDSLEMAYANDTLSAICDNITDALERTLLLPNEFDDVHFHFDMRALVRADLKTRSESYNLALLNGWMSKNEVRAQEGMGPIEGGDVYNTPSFVNAGDNVHNSSMEKPEEPKAEEPKPQKRARKAESKE